MEHIPDARRSLRSTHVKTVIALWTLCGGFAGCLADPNPERQASQSVARLSSASNRPHDPDDPLAGSFELRVIIDQLAAPWDLAYGPDGALWVTERTGKRIVRVDPETSERTTLLTITDAHQSGGQDGVLGFALHPQLLQDQGNDYVYVAYTYDADPGSALDRKTKIVRYSYDATTHTLSKPSEIISGLSGSNDHNAGRLVYGPDAKLYYTIGDQGNNQFDNKCRPIAAQQLPSAAAVERNDFSRYQGKVLRIELDGGIPADNPVLAGVRSHIYSYGHRNPQGLAFGSDGTLYSSEHGPKTDDEINLISSGRNFGWPRIAGFRDDNAYVYGKWSASTDVPCEDLEFSDYALPESVPQYPETRWFSSRFTPPLITFYTVGNDYQFDDPACAGSEYICWPTIAPSSLAVYEPGDDGVPGWGPSLLVPSLKEGSVFRVQLSDDRKSVVGRGWRLFGTTSRYRDVAVGPDNRTFYVITDLSGDTSGPTRGSTGTLEHRGAILEFRYQGSPSPSPSPMDAGVD